MTGVLALQGAFIEHEKMLAKLGEDSFEIRQKSDLDKPFDRLIIPGGESTVMGKLLIELDMIDTIRQRIKEGMPVWGTCAGLILLAEKISGSDTVHIGTMSIEACRNAYGRQLGSFFTKGEFNGTEIPMTFIRAPYISNAGDNVQVLSVTEGRITAARQDKMLVTAFHPELNDSTYIHQYFLDM